MKYVQENPTIPIAPDECSFEHYADVRKNRKVGGEKYSKEYTALIGYCASYGGRYYDGGFARNSRSDDRNSSTIKYINNLNNLKKQASSLKNISFIYANIKSLSVALIALIRSDFCITLRSFSQIHLKSFGISYSLINTTLF